MDWLDRLSMAAIAALTVISIVMVANREIAKSRHDNPGHGAKGEKGSYALQIEMDKKIYKEVGSYQSQGLHAKAIAKLKDIVNRYPEKAQSYVYLARSYVKQGQLGDSIRSYRRGVEMEPEYMDRRTSRYIGDEIKKLVEEGREKFGREKSLKPNDKEVKRTLGDVYYLQRRLAGGCE